MKPTIAACPPSDAMSYCTFNEASGVMRTIAGHPAWPLYRVLCPSTRRRQ